MKRELSFHPEVEFFYADAGGSNTKQIEQVKSFLKKNIDLLIISPNEAEPLTPIVDHAFQQGIPIVVTDRKTSSGLYHAYVGSDNYGIGYLAGQYIGQLLHGEGRLAIIRGLVGSSASIEREKGLSEALKHYPKISLDLRLNGQWLIDTAYQEVKRHREALKEIDALFAFNDQMALGGRRALLNNHLSHRIKIIGVDALPGRGNGLEQIAQGHINASMLYPTGGGEAIRTAMAILEKKAYRRDNLLRTVVIDSSNVQLMKMQADKIDSQQKDIDKQQQLLTEQQHIYRNQQAALNILVVSLVLAIVFAGIAIFALKGNWEKNKHLELQNAEILKQQQQLIAMNEQVKEASEAKANFFTNISHEFKTPLTLILAPIEELLAETKINTPMQEQLLRIKRNGLRLMALISELIDIQRLSKEKITLKAAPHPLYPFLNQIVLSFKPLSVQKHIPITIENKTAISDLWFDADLMEKVIYNLLSNAIKFTPKNGKIQVKIEQNTFGDHVMIRIIDNGKGISRVHMEHIFDPFYQGFHSASGSGLGLALVKEIITLHHGQVTVSSKENEGTSFTLRLPVGDAHLSDLEKAIPTQEYSLEEENLLISDFPFLTDDDDSLRDEQTPGSKAYTLLVIDDNEEIIRFLQDRLKCDYQFYAANNATDGMKLAFLKVPDLIVCDVMMPGKSGIDLLRILKNDPRTASIPVVLLTALDSEEQKTQGLEAMADAYITKPFSTKHLDATIKNLIVSRNELKQRFISELSHSANHSSSTYNESDRRFLNDLSTLVETQLANPQLGVDDICKAIGISRVQLYRKMKSLLQCSVNDYIISRRLKKAKYLLQQDMPINEIAYQTGFASPTYFSTLFKHKFGVSPSAYKKQKTKSA